MGRHRSAAVRDPMAPDCEIIGRVPRLRRARTTGHGEASDPLAYMAVLLGGEAGLRCGEMMALEWRDVDRTNDSCACSDPIGRVTSRFRKVDDFATFR